ncbi:MAG: ABC transporter ATP-binding protein [Christensenellaceae bacterium]|nr:ABC transporter ATP-binding protein [Christensenellaceae bacterium]
MEEKFLLNVEHLMKKFGGLVAVNDVSMHVEKGEIIGLIGANGAGKTTLFNMIAGASAPTSGKIVFKGQEIQGKPSHQICRLGIGRTYQVVKPFQSMTVLENASVGALLRHGSVEVAQQKAREVCEMVGLGHRIDTVGGALGLPELKRMEIARALATEPTLLLLDEVMAGLNPTESEKAIELVRQIRQNGVTVIVIEHVMRAIMSLSDRIYVLNQGNLISTGTPKEVSEDPEVIKSYLGEKRYAKN